jgi:hypothetical protein
LTIGTNEFDGPKARHDRVKQSQHVVVDPLCTIVHIRLEDLRVGVRFRRELSVGTIEIAVNDACGAGHELQEAARCLLHGRSRVVSGDA